MLLGTVDFNDLDTLNHIISTILRTVLPLLRSRPDSGWLKISLSTPSNNICLHDVRYMDLSHELKIADFSGEPEWKRPEGIKIWNLVHLLAQEVGLHLLHCRETVQEGQRSNTVIEFKLGPAVTNTNEGTTSS